MENNQLKEILYIAPEERTINYKWEKNSNLLSPNLAVVTVDDIEHLQKTGWKIKSSVPACEGMTLMRHPYKPQCYMDINLAENELFKDQFDSIGIIAKLVSAKEFSAKAVFVEEERCDFEAAMKGEYNWNKVEGSYKTEAEKKYAQMYCRRETFTGAFSRKDYEEAKNLVSQYKFDDLEYIIAQRNPDHTNRLGSQEVKIELSKELNSRVECAVSLNVLQGIFTLDATTKNTITTKKKVVLETRLEF
jgi:hypothetical protein